MNSEQNNKIVEMLFVLMSTKFTMKAANAFQTYQNMVAG